jgi:5-formyltetrahydrofolate cyclo-ligase
LAEWPGGKPPATIGVAYDSAKCDSLPRGEHDLPLGAIVTESAVY